MYTSKKLSKLPFTGLAYLFESCFLIPQLRDFLLAESAEVLSRQGIDFVLNKSLFYKSLFILLYRFHIGFRPWYNNVSTYYLFEIALFSRSSFCMPQFQMQKIKNHNI